MNTRRFAGSIQEPNPPAGEFTESKPRIKTFTMKSLTKSKFHKAKGGAHENLTQRYSLKIKEVKGDMAAFEAIS